MLEGCSDRKVGLPKLVLDLLGLWDTPKRWPGKRGIPAYWLCVGWVRALRMRSLAGFPSLRLGASGISWQVRE